MQFMAEGGIVLAHLKKRRDLVQFFSFVNGHEKDSPDPGKEGLIVLNKRCCSTAGT